MNSEIAYVPRERYQDAKRNDRLSASRFAEWKACIKYGGIYFLKGNYSEAATPEEYKVKERFDLMPDDVDDLGPAIIVKAHGNVSKYPKIKIGRKFHHWTVRKHIHIPAKRAYRYECVCDCEAKTVQYLTASDLHGGKRRGCQKCANKRKHANAR